MDQSGTVARQRSEVTILDEQLDTITTEGQRLLDFAARDLDQIVPQYPTWTLRDLVIHTASIYARTVTVCATLPQERIPAPHLPAGRDPLDWFRKSVSALVDAFSGTDPKAEVWFMTPDRSVGAWRRRMVIETGVHRWDAQQALEDPEPLLPFVAVSGLDEFGDMWLPRLGDLPTLEVTATDLGRSWKYGSGEPSTVAAGTASELYLRLMARPGASLPSHWETAVDGLAPPAG